jgi:nucleoid DNA-binding protein
MTRTEKKALQYAAQIMTRELKEKGVVKIPDFGKLYVTTVTVNAGVHPMADNHYFTKDTVEDRKSVRFKSFGRLFSYLNRK